MTSNNRSPESGSDPMESVRYRNSIDIACLESPKLWVTVKIDNDTYQEFGVSE